MTASIPERYFERKRIHTELGNGHTAPAKYHVGMPGKTHTNRLKTLREQRGLSQEDLAERIGVKQPTINRYENNNRRLSADKIFLLAEALGVHPGEILMELPTTGMASKIERTAAEIARRLKPSDAHTWFTMGVALARHPKKIA